MGIGRQLKVYLHPADRPAVDRFVHDDLSAVLLAERSPDPAHFEVPDSTAERAGLLICPKRLLGTLAPRRVPARNLWVLDVRREPLIEWSFSKVEDDVLYPGRFYYVPAPLAGPQSLEFLSVAEKMWKWIRLNTRQVPTDWGVERLGPVATEMLLNKDIRLRANLPGSRVQ